MAGEATQVGKELHVDHRIGQPERFRNLPLQKAHSHAALAAGAHHLENFGVRLKQQAVGLQILQLLDCTLQTVAFGCRREKLLQRFLALRHWH